METDPKTGKVLIEKVVPQPEGKPLKWEVRHMDELGLGDVIRYGGKNGRYFQATSDPTPSPLLPGAFQITVQEVMIDFVL